MLNKLLEEAQKRKEISEQARLKWALKHEQDLNQQRRNVYLTLKLTKYCLRHYHCIKFRSVLDKLDNGFKLNPFKIT